MLFGTKNGRLGLVELPPDNGQIIWEIKTQSSSGTNILIIHKMHFQKIMLNFQKKKLDFLYFKDLKQLARFK